MPVTLHCVARAASMAARQWRDRRSLALRHSLFGRDNRDVSNKNTS
jgi:hypothetical protein